MNIQEKTVNDNSSFKEVGLMLDLSRGKVLKVEKVREMIQLAKQFGFTYINLYIEDLLTLEEYPQYGYMRGKYSDREIMKIVSFANEIGIDIFPAIQTLGHLEHFLRWEASSKMMDTPQVLNVNREESIKFLEVLIGKCKSLFGGKKINIGMDEAFDLGQGSIFRSGNLKSQKELYLEHLKVVSNICKTNGYEVIKIWSDMLFSTYSNSDGESLYNTNFKQQIEQLDPAIELIFWNYWTPDQEVYEKILDSHHEFSSNVSMALGIHTWGLPFYNLHQLDVTKAALTACENKGVKDVLFTMWGDDGSLYNLDSAKLGMYETMSHILNHNPCAEEFNDITGLNYYEHVDVSKILSVGINPLLIIWNDPITNIYMKTIDDSKLIEYLNNINSLHIEEKTRSSKIYNLYLECMANDINVYLTKDINTKLIMKAIDEINELENQLKLLWLEEAKINGLEELQLRFETKKYRLKFLLDNKDNVDIINIRNEKCDDIKWIKGTYNNISKATNYRW